VARSVPTPDGVGDTTGAGGSPVFGRKCWPSPEKFPDDHGRLRLRRVADLCQPLAKREIERRKAASYSRPDTAIAVSAIQTGGLA